MSTISRYLVHVLRYLVHGSGNQGGSANKAPTEFPFSIILQGYVHCDLG